LSASANIALQSGLKPNQLPDLELRALKNPSIFSYMEAADFPPYLIDAQIYSDKPNNFMTGFDLDALAGHRVVRRLKVGLAEHEMDFAASEMLAEIIRSEPRSFTYILKAGAHFPYTEKADLSSRPFQPALRAGSATRGTQKTLHSYLNALTWTVDAYLKDLIETLERTGKRVLIIYTSDHGQSVFEPVDGGPHMGFPHATAVDPPIYQAMVPLILFGVGADVSERLSARCDPALRDRVSAFEIFSSALILAGYDYAEIRDYYHHSLFDTHAARDNRVFASGDIFQPAAGVEHELHRAKPRFFLNRFELPQELPASGSESD
jgi:glucan phosphoethanolaminetransferase (alkaline phosphatase superfamily)